MFGFRSLTAISFNVILFTLFRKEAQEKLNRMIIDRMDTQDRILSQPSQIMEFGGDDGTLE